MRNYLLRSVVLSGFSHGLNIAIAIKLDGHALGGHALGGRGAAPSENDLRQAGTSVPERCMGVAPPAKDLRHLV